MIRFFLVLCISLLTACNEQKTNRPVGHANESSPREMENRTEHLQAERTVGGRYDRRPIMKSGFSLDINSSVKDGATSRETANVFRFVTGLDVRERRFDEGEMERELNDIFGKLLRTARTQLPDDIEKTLKFIGEPGQSDGLLPKQFVFIVSESGQIKVSEAPLLPRRVRAVVTRVDEQAQNVVFIAPSMRSDGTLEVMAWDNEKKVFNYYERRFASGNRPLWIWKGDSSHGWQSITRDADSCFPMPSQRRACHEGASNSMAKLA